MLFKKKKIIVKKDNWLMDFAIFLLGATIFAIAFNLFLLPNNIAVGFSGLSVIVNSVWNIKPSIFLFISYIILGILSFVFLGFHSTKKAVIGSMIYPLLVELTSYMNPYFNFNEIEKIVLVFFGALATGFGSGLVYKVGYSTGGTDIVNMLISKFFKRPIGTCHVISNAFIIVIGYIIFGISTVIYSIIVVYVMSIIIYKVMIGISESKTFKVITTNETAIKKFLLSKLSHGVTVIDARGGYTGNVMKMIYCVVPTREYFTVKQGILNLDPEAVIMISDVYEVIGNK